MKKQQVKKYLNPALQIHLLSRAPYSTAIFGRGAGKSFGNGIKQAKKMELMPRSCGLFNSPTYTMIYTKTLIPMMAAWEQHFGYVEGIHYVVGKAPPKWFDRPWHKPAKYENVVTFWNGRTIIFGSFDRPALISGGSYDDVDTDEAYMINKEDYDDFVIPCMRGTHASFKSLDIHRQHTFTSSMPHKNQGDFLLDYREKALRDPKMYSFIGWEPNVKVQKGSTWMNYEVLGAKAITDMLAEMDSISALVMIHNQKVSNFGNTFYPSLGPANYYTPEANNKVVTLPINQSSFKRDATHDEGKDNYNPDLPINIAHDWGKFNCITIDQEYPKEIRFINFMWALNQGDDPKDLDDLADDFCEYYRMHRKKIVYQWGDKSGNDTTANSKETHFEQFASRLRKKGWRVIKKKTGDIQPLDRYRFMNKLHKGNDARLPRVRINKVTCQDLITSLECAKMVGDK
ncbi:MAG TPA: hypothetical protein VGK59_10995, partial [Ohtaekwangia sp.]